MSRPTQPPSPARRAALAVGLKTGAQSMLVLALGPAQLAWGAQLLAVRVWPARDYTRVTLESDTALSATHFVVVNPMRLVIDVKGLELSPQLRDLVRKVRSDDPFISGIRVGRNRPGVVRLVLDLKQGTKPQVFGLAPVAAYQHRTVFDLYPTREADPSVALNAGAPSNDAALPKSTPPLSPPPAFPASPSVSGQTPAAAASGASAAEAMNDSLGAFLSELRRRPGDKAGARPARPDGRLDPRPEIRPDSRPDPRMADAAPYPSPDEDMLRELRRGANRLVIVALDPGHGGEDPGAVGPSGLFEKNVVLSIAMKLRDRINAQRGMRAMLTRDADFFVPLHDRVRKARRVQADLFVSIHADAFMDQQAHGVSVFALSEGGATSAAARWIANKENSSDLVGGVNIKARDAQVARTLLDMSTTAQIKDSLKLGRAVLGHLGRVGRLHKRHVEQAGFAVLKAPDIPSILVETGFISNPEEESKLQDDNYQNELAEAMLAGITRYFARNPPLARDRAL